MVLEQLDKLGTSILIELLPGDLGDDAMATGAESKSVAGVGKAIEPLFS